MRPRFFVCSCDIVHEFHIEFYCSSGFFFGNLVDRNFCFGCVRKLDHCGAIHIIDSFVVDLHSLVHF